MANIPEVSQSNFESEVLKSTLPTLVDFWAPWCGPCRAIAPVMEQLAKEFEGKAKVVKLNTDDNPAVAARFNVASIPTLIIFNNGAEAGRSVGLAPREVIAAKIKELVKG